MTRNLQRLSQLISTFGPGSMLDLPTRSVMIGGLDRCLLIAETSCEMRNVFLDRALIVDTMAVAGASLL